MYTVSPMIQLNNVSKEYGEQSLFEDVSVQLGKGERWAVVGRNGTGKTTLFRLMTGEVLPDGGSINIPKHYRLGYLQQHRAFSQPTLLKEAAQGLRDPSEEHRYHEVESILFGLGFSNDDLSAPPDSFSGGYQLRIQLAQVFASDPDCLLLDEPTNYLDIVSIQWLTRFLQQWKKELLIISHDRAFLDSISTHTVGIVRKNVRKVEGPTEKFYTLIGQQEEIHEKTRQKLQKKKAHMHSYVERFGAKATKAAQAQSRLKALDKLPVLEKLIRDQNLNFSFTTARFRGKKMGEAKNLSFDYESGVSKPLIDNFSLMLEPKARIAIIGKNGRGKSTLLRLLSKELTPQQGELDYSGDACLGVFGQTHVDTLNKTQTVEQAIAAANPHLNDGEIRSVCGWMLFPGDHAKKPISVLSGGEKSRVVLGRILATPTNLLLLDEPTHHLDIESVEALLEAIETFPGAVILVSHSEEVLHRFQPQQCIAFRKGGHQVFLGDYDTFLEKVGWDIEGSEPDQPSEKISKSERVALREQKKSLEKEMDKWERRSQKLLEELSQNEHELAEASMNGDTASVESLSKKRKKLEEAQKEASEKWEETFHQWED